MKVGLILIAVMFGTGCFSYTTLHTATPIEKGETEVNVVPQVWGVSSDDDGSLFIPAAEFELRHGVSDNADFGFRIFLLGIGADFNYAIVNNSSFAFSINPQAGITGIGDEDNSVLLASAYLNLLFDVVKNDAMILTLAAKPGFLIAGVTGRDIVNDFDSGFAPGAGVLAKFRVSRSFAISPGFDILFPTGVSGDSFDATLINFHLGLHF